MNVIRRITIGLIFTIGFLYGSSVFAQQVPLGQVAMTADAGFDGYFREHSWLPVRVQVENLGSDVRGRLVVRSETSGSAVSSTFSTPVDLPARAQQRVTFQIVATDVATQVRVELLDEDDAVIASAFAPLQRIQMADHLSAVITNAAAGAVDLSGVRSGSFAGAQAFLTTADVPEHTGLFDAVDLLLISDADTGDLSDAQSLMLSQWVTSGGHLIVTGGADWQATSAGLADLLPLRPTGAQQVDELSAFTDWLGGDAALSDDTIIATGELTADADVLLATDDGLPLVVRRLVGAGVIDYLTPDPNAAPLRGWSLLPQLWYTLASSAPPQPSWIYGFMRWDRAAEAARILPGFDLLPDILPLIVFVVLYIALVGPVNYLVLNRLNRREWAWITIPVLILAFTALAYVLGANLRGTEITLNQMTLVRSWANTDQARADSVIGMLSPQRAVYGLEMIGAVARPVPLPRVLPGGDVDASLQTTRANVLQSDAFSLQDITIDAGFLANLTASADVPRPSFSGEVVISDDPVVAGQQEIRGVISNDGTVPLRDAVILARSTAYRLAEPLEPGDVVPFTLTIPGEDLPAPTLYRPLIAGELLSLSARREIQFDQTLFDILGDNVISDLDSFFIDESLGGLDNRRRQLFVNAFVRDSFGMTGRADDVYLLGWTDEQVIESEVTGANWRTEDTTLHVIQLAKERSYRPEPVVVSRDQFVWAGRSPNGVGAVAPISVRLDPGEEVTFRFTPVPSARLDVVESISIVFEGQTTGTRRLPFSLWDWAEQVWVDMQAEELRYRVPNFQRFVGPMNAVEMRLRSDDVGGFFRVERVAIEQSGRFER